MQPFKVMDNFVNTDAPRLLTDFEYFIWSVFFSASHVEILIFPFPAVSEVGHAEWIRYNDSFASHHPSVHPRALFAAFRAPPSSPILSFCGLRSPRSEPSIA